MSINAFKYYKVLEVLHLLHAGVGPPEDTTYTGVLQMLSPTEFAELPVPYREGDTLCK